jgi:hypothetical protein
MDNVLSQHEEDSFHEELCLSCMQSKIFVANLKKSPFTKRLAREKMDNMLTNLMKSPSMMNYACLFAQSGMC